MKNKLICAALIILSLLILLPVRVQADEVTTETYSSYYEYINIYGMHRRINVNYTTDGSYYLVLNAYPFVDSDGVIKHSCGFAWYNPNTGDYKKVYTYYDGPSSVNVNSYSIWYYEDDGSYTTDSYPTVFSGSSPVDSIISVGSLMVVEFDFDTYGFDSFHDMYQNGELSVLVGYDYWNVGNRYNYDSMYSASVVAPQVRNAYLYDLRNNYKGLMVRFLLPGLEDNADYYTELWADVPTGYDNNGNVIYQKVHLKTYKASDIFRMNTVISSSSGSSGSHTDPNTETIDPEYSATYGSYYQIKEVWSSILPMITEDEAAMYGGVIFYVRSAVHVSDSVRLVSDFSYFLGNPSNTKYPTIYNGNGANFDENAPNNNDDTDATTPNSDDVQYIGGVTDDPGISSDNSISTGNGKWKYTFTGNWTVGDFENWVNNGFGLSGNGGLLGLIGNIFYFLPADFMNYLFWLLVAIAVLVVINIVT